MKKTLFFTLIVSSLLLAPLAYADFAADYQNFLKTYEAYRTAHNDYTSARNRYLQFQTLVSKNEALDAVKNFLVWRDDVLLGYISLLRTKPYDSSFTTLLAQEETFISEHKDKSKAVGSLEDAVEVSKEVEQRHVTVQTMSRKIVGLLLLAKVEDFNRRFVEMENEANTLITQLKAQGFEVRVPERWLLDAKNKQFLAEEKIKQARNQIDALKGKTVADVSSEYNKVQFSIFEANQYIREGNDFLFEVVESIKYGKF